MLIYMVLLASINSADDFVELDIESDLHNFIHQWLSNNTRVFNTTSLCDGYSGVTHFHRSLFLPEIDHSLLKLRV
jgi:hypothetical protein